MFKIGEFARMGRVSVRALRHYDELGLLKPREIDPFSGYRYYAAAQLERLNRIVAFKEIGLGLDEIGRLLEADLTPGQLKAALELRRAELEWQAAELAGQKLRLENWLTRLEENSMNTTGAYEITLKKIEPLLVASLRQSIPAYGYLGGPFGTLRSYLAGFGFERRHPSLVLWHFSGAGDDSGFEVELAEQLDETLPGNGQIRVYRLPGIERAASVTHRGGLDEAYRAYQALGRWVEEHGSYRPDGPTRQIHHVFNPQADPATFITEFQMPLRSL